MLATIRKFLLLRLVPITKWIGKTHLPYTKKLLHAAQYHYINEILKPGMILLTRTDGEASNLLIPGKYKHCAISINPRFIVEAVGRGVIMTDLIDFILSKDHIAILKPKFCSDLAMESAARWAADQIGKPYDYEFQSSYAAFYCCELSYAAYQTALGGQNPWRLREFWGEPTVTPDDFILADKKWEVVLEF